MIIIIDELVRINPTKDNKIVDLTDILIIASQQVYSVIL